MPHHAGFLRNFVMLTSKHDKIVSLLNKPYTLIDGVFHCVQAFPAAKSAGKGFTAALQGLLKTWPGVYQFLVDAFSPVLVSRSMGGCQGTLLGRHGPDHVLINLGSGPLGLPDRPDMINVDISAFACVDVCADAVDLPFPDDCVDCLVNLAMLEHVPHPEAVISEMRRILKPGGEFFCYLPFCQPLHAAPYDFTRWTQDGVKGMFADFQITETGIGAGPTSGWLWVTVEWLSMLLSFGNATAKDFLALGLMLLLFPVKHLDRLLERHPSAGRIASGFYIVGTKPQAPGQVPAGTA